MSCKVCRHTVQRVNDGEPAARWCPRCGTIGEDCGVPDHEAPMLVERAMVAIIRLEDESSTVEQRKQIARTLRETVGLPLDP
jgi:hypothetical protein